MGPGALPVFLDSDDLSDLHDLLQHVRDPPPTSKNAPSRSIQSALYAAALSSRALWEPRFR